MANTSQRVRNIREADEFNVERLVSRVLSQRVSAGAYSWSLEQIQAARDAQMAGRFQLPARLAESFRTDDAMYVAHRNRLAPQRALPVKLEPADDSPAAAAVHEEASPFFGPDGVSVTPETLVEINSHLANHGVAFATCTLTPREDASRVDLEVHSWPIEFVRWDSQLRSFVTRVDPEWIRLQGDGECGLTASGELRITHGDGRWIVFAAREIEPWKDCCLLPGALTWARHAFGLRDWAKASVSHGNPKVIGQLPEGVAIGSPEGDRYLELLIAVAMQDSPAGIEPHGAETRYIVNQSSAWQIFKELATGSEISASRIYIGQDGSLGTNGTGPGIDVRALFGVTDDIVEGDLHCIERCLQTGAIEPWAALNFGTSALAPRRVYEIPDADQAARREANATQREAFYAAIEKERSLGFNVTSERIAMLAEEHGVTSAQLLPVVPTAPATSAPAEAQPKAPPPPDAFPVEEPAGEPMTDAAVVALAEKMTAHGVERCEHGYPNRCRMCGIERVRDYDLGPDGQPLRDRDGNVIWRVAWRPIERSAT